MSWIRQHVRGSRRATAGLATTATLLAGVLSPAADAAERPSRAAALDNAATALADQAASLGLTSAQETSVRDVIVDKDGAQHVRYDRTYRRLPVLGGDFVVHMAPDGTYRSADRAARAEISLPSTTPKVSASRAADLGVNALRAANPGDTLEQLKQVKAKPELVVDALHGVPRLAWRTEVTGLDSLGNPVARTLLTDAHTGARIDAWDTMESATGDGKSLYSGTVTLETTLSGSAYQLKDPTRGNTYTADAADKTDACTDDTCNGRLVTDDDNHWGTGTTADRSTVAVDAQYGSDMTWDYYKDVHGRNGIGDDGKGSYNRVHYGNKLSNAFWNDACFCMTYGDGNGIHFGPMVGLDVAAHEMSHGVTSRTARLVYSGESGGLNEATSDIFGTLVEFYAGNAQDTGDYLIGEKVVRSGLGRDALRFMDRPSKDGGSADYWSSSVGTISVHYSSGVANHFAYLLAEGSGTKTINGVTYDSPTYNRSTVTGIGRAKLGAIWYRALTVYMTSSTNYAGARTATLNAARDLYGAGSTEYNAVAAAWSAVNVN
ncbi:M4 family metallopeptidase [Streptomyces neyagawaensis]|uniref:M4 family metallopeptidase n=2 Tax=Streptomyces neyagawaensis TaxID=42238 RepID=UPI00201D28F8|nr:M4 family metallopeptidase [Streptomyces neyagawaensis]MCL6734220.1 M4 family metallopeptidase [Streptomyces neyagawaensis]MDE1681153.1 M4 family metallopeptidase [Streptomyces neyagawaensis]